MLTVCFTAKGGQGCSTVAAMLAIRTGATLVDVTGDLPAVLGLPDPDGPGLTDTLIAGSPIGKVPGHIRDHGAVRLVPSGRRDADNVPAHRWPELAQALAKDAQRWVLDAGTGPARVTAHHADQSLLVSRYCYLALRRAVSLAVRPTGAVAIREDGRSLGRDDLERTTGAPVVAEIPCAPEIARAIDAGLLAARGVPRVAMLALDLLADGDRRGQPERHQGHGR
jgi:hypothetical protein